MRDRAIKPLSKAGLIITLLVVGVAPAAWAQDPIHKFGRGAVNVLTCWIELPKNFHLGMQEANPVLGVGGGVIKGIGLAATRFVLGAYEVVSFPVPYPKAYASPYEALELSDYSWE